MNKTNKNNSSYFVKESIVDFNILQLVYCNKRLATLNTKQLSFIYLINIPRKLINTIPETPNLGSGYY